MKVKVGNYANRLTCNIHTCFMDYKYGVINWPDETLWSHEDYVFQAIEDGIQSVYDIVNWIWFDRRTQKVKVRIDKWDTWSMDHTLAPIILPMLKQLKETKHGAPYVYPVDVPTKLRPTKKELLEYTKKAETDPKWFDRWDYVLDEMIWAFEQKNRDHWEDDYYGPYIESEDKRELFGRFEWIDDEGRQKHQERMTNGFKLFGKYYENLWD
jgi:hypothetical protein